MEGAGSGRGRIRDLRCYVTVLQDNRERKEMAEKSLREEMQRESSEALLHDHPSRPLTQPPRFVFGEERTSSWIRHWVTGSAHCSICSVATMTSVAAGKWPLQARHMLLLRRGATPSQPHHNKNNKQQRRGAGSTMFGLPLKLRPIIRHYVMCMHGFRSNAKHDYVRR
ncbi:LOW QUALITY PROTEIN: uncharacterized protein Dere_GG26921, partial [Drosophila erecta]